MEDSTGGGSVIDDGLELPQGGQGFSVLKIRCEGQNLPGISLEADKKF